MRASKSYLAPATGVGRSWRHAKWILLLYMLLMLISSVIRWQREPHLPENRQAMTVAEFEVSTNGDLRPAGSLTLGWRTWPASPKQQRPDDANPETSDQGTRWPVVLLHGSPGDADTFWALGPALAQLGSQVLAPDLPGFGASSHSVADYSIRSHAATVADWLGRRGIEKAHLVGFSMGSGVALELYDQRPDLVASTTLVGGIGVQEMELLGSYQVNHIVHGGQLVLLWAVRNLVPHFGLFDGGGLDNSYARNFFDTDQRPLRRILQSFDGPMLIVHGETDFLVPSEAAREHHRLVPHSELWMREDGHFFVFTQSEVAGVAERLHDFFQAAETGNAPTRLDATPERLEAARAPFDPERVPEWTGPTILAVILLLVIASLGSEDLTCLGAGLLVAQGRLALLPAILGCLAGVIIGDLLLFALGRIFGRRLVGLAPFRWWISEERLAESSAWLNKRGLFVILLSRFTPGARLPTYFAAGVLDTRLRHFLFYFVVAASLWTPLVVGLSSRLGDTALERWSRLQGGILLVAALLLLSFVVVQRVLIPMSTRRGRKKLLGQIKRLRHYEFWPSWALYLPLIVYLVWQGLRHRGLTLFSALNPAIPAGGLVGESKAEILTGLESSGNVPTWRLLPVGQESRAATAIEFGRQQGLAYPLVLKPDSGERGSEVLIAGNDQEIERYFEAPRGDTLIQEYVPGVEYGVFYYRYLDQPTGRILSICKKTSPTVTGDGVRTLEQLILDDDRAVAIAHVYLREVADRKNEIPAAGRTVVLTDIGAHSRGMIFEEGNHLITEALETEVDRISKSYQGFDFGRFDFRVPDEQDLLAGRNLAIIELNGVTSESTNLYDRRYSVFQAWQILCRQWRIAYEIGAQRRAAGDRPWTLLQLWRLWREAR